MTISTPPEVVQIQTATPGTPRDPSTPEEAAEQFEAVLVRQFVATMTKGLFQSESGGAGAAQADAQRDAMTTALTDELVASGALRFRDLLLRQWGQDAGGADSASGAGADGPGAAGAAGPPRPERAPVLPAHAAPARSAPAGPAPAVPTSADAHFDLLRRAAALGKTRGRP